MSISTSCHSSSGCLYPTQKRDDTQVEIFILVYPYESTSSSESGGSETGWPINRSKFLCGDSVQSTERHLIQDARTVRLWVFTLDSFTKVIKYIHPDSSRRAFPLEHLLQMELFFAIFILCNSHLKRLTKKSSK